MPRQLRQHWKRELASEIKNTSTRTRQNVDDVPASSLSRELSLVHTSARSCDTCDLQVDGGGSDVFVDKPTR